VSHSRREKTIKPAKQTKKQLKEKRAKGKKKDKAAEPFRFPA
jgi:hypothetical protein